MDTPIAPGARADRANTDLATVVDQALAVRLEHGSSVVARFLTERGAGFALTCRVLTEPSCRRPLAFDLSPPLS
jgi:hypothetical protein